MHKTNMKRKYDYSEDLVMLDEFLDEAKISDDLREAIEELKTALKNKNYQKAYELSSVKSIITSNIDAKTRVFREDSEYNKKKLGTDAYGYLDGLHHKITFQLMEQGKNVMPSGSMIVSVGGIRSKGLPKGSSPSIRKIRNEFKTIREETLKELKK